MESRGKLVKKSKKYVKKKQGAIYWLLGKNNKLINLKSVYFIQIINLIII